VHKGTRKKKKSHKCLQTCAEQAFAAAVFVVAVHVGLVGVVDARIAQEAATLAAPTKSPVLEDGAEVGTCKIACCLGVWAEEWAWVRVWGMVKNLKYPHLT